MAMLAHQEVSEASRQHMVLSHSPGNPFLSIHLQHLRRLKGTIVSW